MPLEDAFAYIDQAINLPSAIQGVGITGGEPFLFFDEVLQIVRYASERGLPVRCITNGFWATSEARAAVALERLKAAGLCFLGLSADSFHQEHVPLENVKRVLRLCREIGLRTSVNVAVTRHSWRLSDLLVELGDCSQEAYFHEILCLPTGRAGISLARTEFFDVPGIPMGRCAFMGVLMVLPDGDVYPCCSAGGMTRPLLMGNVASETLREMVDKSSKNFLYSLLEWYGPACFVPAIEEEGLGHMLDTAYVNECHLCYEILSNPELAEIAVKVVKHEEILHLKRALEKALLIS